jgi:hypothetical protein
MINEKVIKKILQNQKIINFTFDGEIMTFVLENGFFINVFYNNEKETDDDDDLIIELDC